MANTKKIPGRKGEAEAKNLPAEEKNETIQLDLPEVKDIPGQEHIRPPLPAEFRDTTISSADEEGDELFREDEDELTPKGEGNVSPIEKRMLSEAAEYVDQEEEAELKRAMVENTDEDGDPLNEETGYKDLSAKDLDIGDEYEDDEDEELGKDSAG